jgi:hypothetical protein
MILTGSIKLSTLPSEHSSPLILTMRIHMYTSSKHRLLDTRYLAGQTISTFVRQPHVGDTILELIMEGHRHSIACGALIWSIAVTSMAGSRSFGAIVTSRLFIGLGEAMFGQAVGLHYSFWYKKDEMAKRLALFIGSGVLAGA